MGAHTAGGKGVHSVERTEFRKLHRDSISERPK